MNIVDQAGILYDYAVGKPEGFTFDDVHEEFGWGKSSYAKIVRRLRLDLGEDEINLVCEPQGMNEVWNYKLVGNYNDASFWTTNRIGDMESRLETIKNVAGSVTKATDGRTLEGKIARKITNTISYLLVEIGDLRNGLGES